MCHLCAAFYTNTGTILIPWVAPLSIDSFTEFQIMIFPQPMGMLPSAITRVFQVPFYSSGFQLATFVEKAMLGPMIAFNWFYVYADITATSLMNNKFLGFFGEISCPSIGTSALISSAMSSGTIRHSSDIQIL